MPEERFVFESGEWAMKTPFFFSSSSSASGETYKIALITMDSIDQHWITLKEGAEKVAKDLGVDLVFMAPNTKDDAQQIEQVRQKYAQMN